MESTSKPLLSKSGPSSPASERNQASRRWKGRVPALLGGILLLSLAGQAVPATDATGKVLVDDSTFKCLTEMVKVRHFFVDNLLGNRDATVAVAKEGSGVYPPGSVVQLIPGEVMVKQEKGFNPATRDWEFFELDVSKDGSKIRKRGFVDVNNRFGGNCFACHVKARPEFDFVCEKEHGCDDIPVTRRMIAALQNTDARCAQNAEMDPEDAKAIQELGEVLKTMGQK